MRFCVNCGVELEEDMQRCPLCGTSVSGVTDENDSIQPEPSRPGARREVSGTRAPREKYLLQRILWQVTSILLFSGIISTLIIDLAAHRRVTWSIYPVTVCMIIFSYASLFAFWHTRKIYQILAGLLIASFLFFVVDRFLPEAQWPLQLGLPLLFAVNLVGIILIASITVSQHRGLNVIAYTGVAFAVLCISIEAILSLYQKGSIVLVWSVIVAACILPVTVALLFMHYRIKKNPAMEKIFHT